MTFLDKEIKPRFRIAIDSDDFKDRAVTASSDSKITRDIDYHDGNDRYYVTEKMAERFATEAVKEEGPDGKIQTYVIKSKPAQQHAVKNGLFEVTPRGGTRKVTSIAANLVENSEFKFTSNGSVDDEATEDIKNARQQGRFALKLSRTDELSVLNECCAFLVQVIGPRFDYQPVPANKIFVIFGDKIEEGEGGEERPVDNLDLEDALCIVVHMGGKKFAAYYGRSDLYPNGRFVQYENEEWHKIPEVGVDENAVEWTDDGGEIANPLTVNQDRWNDYTAPEYPIVIWYGGPSGASKELLPTSSRLVESDLEIGLSASRTQYCANVGARGQWIYETDLGATPSYPETFAEGMNMLKPGNRASVITVPSGNIDIAEKVNNNAMHYMLNTYNVPSYISGVSQDVTVHSGAALMELNRPMNMMRQKRTSVNQSGMARIFDIERGLASVENDRDTFAEIEQTWIVNDVQIFRTETEILDAQQKKKALRITDEAQILVDVEPEIDNREQAKNVLDELELQATPAAQGTLGRFQGLGNGGQSR